MGMRIIIVLVRDIFLEADIQPISAPQAIAMYIIFRGRAEGIGHCMLVAGVTVGGLV